MALGGQREHSSCNFSVELDGKGQVPHDGRYGSLELFQNEYTVKDIAFLFQPEWSGIAVKANVDIVCEDSRRIVTVGQNP